MMFGLGGMSTGLLIVFGAGRVLLFALFVYIIFRIVQKIKMNNDSAFEMLKLKFVKGEISEEEYSSKVEFLKNTHRKKVKNEKI